MPTGYTNFIEEGKIDNARDFLMLCIRNFGVAIDFRDEPLSLSLLVFDKRKDETLKYYKERLAEHKKEKDDFSKKPFEQIKEDRIQHLKSEISYYEGEIERYEYLKELYSKIEFDVQAWNCEEEFENIKKFALQQLSTADYDWSIDWYKKELEKDREELANIDESINAYIESNIKVIEEQIKECEKDVEKRSKRIDDDREFYNRLIESIDKIR